MELISGRGGRWAGDTGGVVAGKLKELLRLTDALGCGHYAYTYAYANLAGRPGYVTRDEPPVPRQHEAQSTRLAARAREQHTLLICSRRGRQSSAIWCVSRP